VAIARALISRPAVIFADEPTGNLDSKTGDEVLALLRKAVDDFGQTVIMVTHDAHAAAYADRVVVLVDGRVVHDGGAATSEEILDLMKAVA
jgi:putative ABC transport system ATP-binding protein